MKQCYNCGTLMDDIIKPSGGSLAKLTLRTRNSVRASNVVTYPHIAQFVFTATGTQNNVISAVNRDIKLGKYADLVMNWHMLLQNIAINAYGTGALGTPPIFSGTIYYASIDKGIRYPLIAYSNGAISYNVPLNLLIDETYSDENPLTLGSITADMSAIALGTATNVTIDVRVGLGILYEAVD